MTKDNNIDLSMVGPGLRKLKGGKIIEITPAKVPRLVGKQGSMISMMKDKTGCSIFAGQNGRVWIKGQSTDAERIATEAVLLVEEKAHIRGLTDYMKKYLEDKCKDLKVVKKVSKEIKK